MVFFPLSFRFFVLLVVVRYDSDRFFCLRCVPVQHLKGFRSRRGRTGRQSPSDKFFFEKLKDSSPSSFFFFFLFIFPDVFFLLKKSKLKFKKSVFCFHSVTNDFFFFFFPLTSILCFLFFLFGYFLLMNNRPIKLKLIKKKNTFFPLCF